MTISFTKHHIKRLNHYFEYAPLYFGDILQTCSFCLQLFYECRTERTPTLHLIYSELHSQLGADVQKILCPGVNPDQPIPVILRQYAQDLHWGLISGMGQLPQLSHQAEC